MRAIRRAVSRVSAELGRYAHGADRQAIRRELAREAFFRAAGRFTPTVEVEWASGRYLVATADRDVSRVTFMVGPYGLETLRRAVQLMGLHGHAPVAGREVLEIGANIGTTTIPLVHEFGAAHVHAFEPSPVNYRLLRQNVLANGLEASVTTYEMAVSDRDGKLPFVSTPRNGGSSHVAAESEATHFVPALRVDALLERGTITASRLGLVWIDVEGHEAAVLAGADLLGPVPIVIEYQPRLYRDVDRLNELITRRRGRVFDLSSGAEVSASDLVGRNQAEATDLLLLPAVDQALST